MGKKKEWRIEYEAARHEKFDEMWAEHERLVFWWAYKLARIFNRAFGEKRFTHADFLGHLTVRFNYVLHKFDSERAAFSTLFSLHLIGQTLDMVVRRDSESLAVRWWQRNVTEEEKVTAEQIKEYHENDYFMYRIPENESWTDEILDMFPTTDKLWEFLTSNLKDRYKTIIQWRYRDDMTLQQIGDLLGITKERVRQIEVKTMESIKNRVKTLERFRALFVETPHEDEE